MLNLTFILEVLKDVRMELDEPEVADLTSLALDRKVDRAINEIEKELKRERNEDPTD